MELETIDYRAPDAAKKFVESLRTTGFGVLSHHPIPKDVLTYFYDQWVEKFFSHSEEDKQKFAYEEKTQHGFFSNQHSETAKGNNVPDIKEFYQYYAKYQKLPEGLEQITQKYYQKAQSFASELLQWVEDHTPKEVAINFSQSLSAMIDQSEQTMLRVLHYPPMQGTEKPGAIRAAAHEDICLLTILPASNEPGLQIQRQDGTWLDVSCNFGNIIINIGDMLQEASQGYFPSTTHRVINPTGEKSNTSRVSLPLFLHPNSDVVLSSKYTAGSFLNERLKELGLLT